MTSGPVPIGPGELWIGEFARGSRFLAMTIRRDTSQRRWVTWHCVVTELGGPVPLYRGPMIGRNVIDWPDHRLTRLCAV